MSLTITALPSAVLLRACGPERRERELDAETNPDADDDAIHYLAPAEGFERQADGLVAGYYRASTAAGSLEFRATAYGLFRRHLCFAVTGRSYSEASEASDAAAPLADLLFFADQEGVIGPRTSTKLARELAALAPQIAAHVAAIVAAGGDAAAADTWADKLAPLPDAATLLAFQSALPGTPANQADLARRYFESTRDLVRESVRAPSFALAFQDNVRTVEKLFAAVGSSGCVVYS